MKLEAHHADAEAEPVEVGMKLPKEKKSKKP